MNLFINGSRTINNKDFVYSIIKNYINDNPKVNTIISGGAKGVDLLAKQYSIENNINYIEYKPDWKKYGKGAGIVRNITMLEECDLVLSFWDGKSKGTKFNINYCKKNNKPITLEISKDDNI